MRLNLTALRIFLAADSVKSIIRAAEREHIAPSAISKRIHDLELDLKTPLFRRHPRGVSAGEALVLHVRCLSDTVGLMEADLGNCAKGLHGKVRGHAHSSRIPNEASIPATRTCTVTDCAADTHDPARGMVVDVDNPLLGWTQHAGVVSRFDDDGEHGRSVWPDSSLGQHNTEVFGALREGSR